jgi:HPt (histidine-containing phosphotransfer) domain-containing protein
MREASEKGDLAEVARLGHRLKGTIVYLGAEPAEKAAIAVEKIREDGGEKAEAEKLVRALEHECELLESAMALHEGLTATPDPSAASVDLSPPVDASIFCLEAATQRCFNKRQLLQRMVEYFFKDVDRLLPQMRSALANGDVAEVGHLGHRFKGTLVNLVATRATEAALRVERFATTGGQLADAEEAVRELERECETLGIVLTAYRPANGPPQEESNVE